MIITYENIFTLFDYRVKPCPQLKGLNAFTFLSFQDALHYLIKAYHLQGKKILVPAFYCDATIRDMEKHGLSVQLCKIDQKKFDIDVPDFIHKLQMEQPDIIMIYNFFGKNSCLYQDLSWKKYLKQQAFIISDFAHSLVGNHKIEFLNENHFYIDSTRKTTSQMMAHLIAQPGVQLDTAFVRHYAFFKCYIRFLFFLKTWCLQLATTFHLKIFSRMGMWLYLLHDKYIGSPEAAFSGYRWDNFLYHRIRFEKIKQHRRLLYQEYRKNLTLLADQGFIECFDLPQKEEENMCFFFIRIIDTQYVMPISTLLTEQGFWAEVLWDFDAIKEITPEDKAWAKSIIVMPYTVRTKPRHIQRMRVLLEKFFYQTLVIS